MNDQIKTYTAKCDIFRVVGFTQPIETLLPCKMPSSPWTKMGLDLFSFDNRDYFISVVITNILVISNRQLTRHKVYYHDKETESSDNGSQCTSQEFQRFSRLWEKQLLPWSNDKIESSIKVAKILLLQVAGEDPYPVLVSLQSHIIIRSGNQCSSETTQTPCQNTVAKKQTKQDSCTS